MTQHAKAVVATMDRAIDRTDNRVSDCMSCNASVGSEQGDEDEGEAA